MNYPYTRPRVGWALALFSVWFFSLNLLADIESEPPVIEAVFPDPGATHDLTTVEIHFSEAVKGVDASDLLVNGVPCPSVRQVNPDIYVFSLPSLDPGAVELKWLKLNGITDLADSSNLFVGESLQYVLLPPARPGGVILSEILPDNHKHIRDEDGDYEDWIELQNITDQDISLLGWHLTDAPEQPLKWTFPEVTLPAGGFLVVFASAKDRVDPTNRLHTNFKLGNEGEYLGLTAPDGIVVNDFAPRYPATPRDVSFGRASGAPDQTGFFNTPTPGKLNDVSGAGFAPAIEFSLLGRTVTESNLTISLSLATPAPSATIRYTLDGKLPTLTNGFDYTDRLALTLSNAVIVRARAFQTNYFPGPVHSETYTLLTPTFYGEPFATNSAGTPLRHVLNPNIQQFRSDLPLLVINTYGKIISEGGNLPVNFSIFETKGGVATVTNLPDFQSRGGIKVRGSSSASLNKHQYAIQWTDEFNQDKELSPLGLPAESEWVLYAPDDYEPVSIHNPFIYQLARDIGEYAPRTRFVEVFVNRIGPLTTNQYEGLYVLEEKIGVGNGRIPPPKLQPEDNTLPDLSGPYLMKIDRLDPGDSGLNAGAQNVALITPKEKELKQPARAPQKKYITDYINAMNRGFTPALRRNSTNGYEAFINMNQAIDYHIIETLSGNVDALVLSAYFYKPRNGKLVFGPHWDFDRALGSTDGRDANPRVWLAGPFFNGWLGSMLADVEAWQRWADRYQQLRTQQLANAYTWSLMDQLANQIRQAEKRDFQRWKIVRRFGGYQGELDAMKRWVSNRLEFIDRQFVQPPVIDRPSGLIQVGDLVSLTLGRNPSTNAAIWYTLDGSDPRGVGVSNRSASAMLYTGPFSLSNNVRVVARTLDNLRRQTGGPTSSTPWSGPTARTWLTNRPPLALTEIHFHPLGDGHGSGRQTEDFEFLEFKNTSGTLLDLSGFQLAGDVEFLFVPTNAVTRLAPNARVLLVKNARSFASRYGALGGVAGEYTGHLSDSRGRLLLTAPAGQVIFDFVYEDNWVYPADGDGYSMVVRSEAMQAYELDTPTAWVASSEVHGSPGQPDLASDVSPDTDLNGNGLPDVWERAYFGLIPVTGAMDSDGDGYTNREEYLAGTDPRLASSAPRLEAIPSPFGGNPILHFERVGGRSYRLLYRDQLAGDASWSELLRFPGDVTSTVGEFRDLTTTNSARFYRMSTP